MMVVMVDWWSWTRNNEEYDFFLSGAGAIDPTDPAAAAASKMQNLVLFLIQVDLASNVCLFVICCAPRKPSR